MRAWTFSRLLPVLAAMWVAGGALGQTLRVEAVLPAATDPAINGWLGAHYTAFDTAPAHRQLLFVYLHGQGGTGTGATDLVKTAAVQGFHAVGLTYANDWSPFNFCNGTGDPNCPENVRLEIVDGADHSPFISVSRANSVENRIIKLMAHLHTAHPSEGWDQFVQNGVIRWDRVAVWGHSQGGGNAGVIARHHSLARVCTSAPAADGGQGNPAAWWATHATPSASYFGFCHSQDGLSQKVAFWNALGMAPFGPVTDVASSTPPYAGTHELSSTVAPAQPNQYHNSVVSDAVTPRNPDGTPVYRPVWEYMMTAGLSAPGPGQVWDNVVFATVPTETGTTNLMMDIYSATTGTGPRPTLVWVHGGGWQSGSQDNVPAFALAMRSRGISVASIHYRLSHEAVFPAQIEDCKGAIRYLRANAATYGLDPARFGVWGSSAGGHLAALVATSGGVEAIEGTTGGNVGFSSSVMVGGDFYGPTDILSMSADCAAQAVGCSFDHDASTSPESKLLGVDGAGEGLAWLRANISNPAAPFPTLAERAMLANSLSHVDPADPPMWIAHGDLDTTVPIGQSERLRSALLGAGVTHVYSRVEGFGHGSLGDEASAAAAEWIGNVLLGLPACDSIDFNGDGLTPDTADLGDFVSVFAGGVCSTGACGDIDFNNDGLFPDTLDIDALLSVFSGGACV